MHKKKYNIAIVGATGVVGETLLELLEARDFPVDQLFLLASENSVGKTAVFRDKTYQVEPVETFEFSKADFAFFAAGNDISLKYALIAAKAGCVVIDKSSAFRYDNDVPLIVPEVNGEQLAQYKNKNIIANPNCNVIPIVVALKPIVDHFGISRMNVATYQSVSGAGKKGIAALRNESVDVLNGQTIKEITLDRQIAFNVIPKIDDFHQNGYTLEEMKVVLETQKIFNDTTISINPTAVRVPVFVGHSAAVHLETKKYAELEAVRDLLKNSPSVVFMEENDYSTPVHAAHQDAVFVGRLRRDISHNNGLNLWVVADNVRKGAALNAIQIVERLVNSGDR